MTNVVEENEKGDKEEPESSVKYKEKAIVVIKENGSM